MLLIVSALALTVYNVAEDKRAAREADNALSELNGKISDGADKMAELELSEPLYKSHREMDMPIITIDGVEYIGVLELKSLGLKLPVRAELSDSALKTAPCRYSGSVYLNNMIVAGHNYASHFSGLKRLNIGDEVCFTDGDGNVFNYRVGEIQSIDGSDVDAMTAGEWDMTLFTCTYSGSRRVTVRLFEEDPSEYK
jgi:sortase A